jgi:hypothetical protein
MGFQFNFSDALDVNVKSFRALRDFLLSWQKEAKPSEPDASRCGGAASVPCAPRPMWHGARTRCAQTGAPLRPHRPAVLGSLYGSLVQECNGNGNGNGNGGALPGREGGHV